MISYIFSNGRDVSVEPATFSMRFRHASFHKECIESFSVSLQKYRKSLHGKTCRNPRHSFLKPSICEELSLYRGQKKTQRRLSTWVKVISVCFASRYDTIIPFMRFHFGCESENLDDALPPNLTFTAPLPGNRPRHCLYKLKGIHRIMIALPGLRNPVQIFHRHVKFRQHAYVCVRL